MQEATSREKILKKVRKALINKSKNTFSNIDFDSNVFHASEESLEISFAKNFSEKGGKFIFCEDYAEFITHLHENFSSQDHWEEIICLEDTIKEVLFHGDVPFSDTAEKINIINIAVIGCEFLIARTGSIVVSSRQLINRKLITNSKSLIVLAYSSQVLADGKDALKELKNKYSSGLPSSITYITGPSFTMDIERKKIYDIFGPRSLYLFLIDDAPLHEPGS